MEVGIFSDFFSFSVRSTLLHLPPLRFHCVGGCWNGTLAWTVATTALAVRSSKHNHKIKQLSSRLFKQSGICFFIVFTTLFTVIQHYFKYPGFYVLLTVYSCNCEERSYLMDKNVSSLMYYICRGDRKTTLILEKLNKIIKISVHLLPMSSGTTVDYSIVMIMFISASCFPNFLSCLSSVHLSGFYTENGGQVRIQYKRLVPIYAFLDMKLSFPKQNYNVLSPSSYTHILICERFIYFQDLPIILREKSSWDY